MPEMHLKQPGFTYRASGLFIINKERIEKFMQTKNTYLFTKISSIRLAFNIAYGEQKDFR